MLVLAIILLAYILEPVLKAGDDRVEIDAAVDTPPVPDFRALLESDEDAPGTTVEVDDSPKPVPQPEPAEHRS